MEVAIFLPMVMLCAAYAIEFAFFFIIAATLSTSSRNAVEYSVQGYQSPGQIALPAAGPMTAIASVSSLAVADLGSSATTYATVQVCSKSIGVTNKATNCQSYGAGANSSTTAATQVDPEAPTFLLNRVDVTYTVQPPIPLKWFSVSLIPTLTFHRHSSMRVMD